MALILCENCGRRHESVEDGQQCACGAIHEKRTGHWQGPTLMGDASNYDRHLLVHAELHEMIQKLGARLDDVEDKLSGEHS